MKNEDVVKAFSIRKKAKSYTGSIWSTGDCLYSYHTCIAEYDKNDRLYMNLTKYSVTTSHHQSLMKKHLINIVYKTEYNIIRNKLHIVPADERI